MTRIRTSIRVVFGLLYFSLLVMGISARRGWLDWDRIRRQNSEMEAKTKAALLQKNQILSQIEELQKSPREQERVVRQVLGYIRPNEAVIEFQ